MEMITGIFCCDIEKWVARCHGRSPHLIVSRSAMRERSPTTSKRLPDLALLPSHLSGVVFRSFFRHRAHTRHTSCFFYLLPHQSKPTRPRDPEKSYIPPHLFLPLLLLPRRLGLLLPSLHAPLGIHAVARLVLEPGLAPQLLDLVVLRGEPIVVLEPVCLTTTSASISFLVRSQDEGERGKTNEVRPSRPTDPAG